MLEALSTGEEIAKSYLEGRPEDMLWSQSPIGKHKGTKAQVDGIAKGAHGVGMTLPGFVNKATRSTTIYIRFAECVATAL